MSAGTNRSIPTPASVPNGGTGLAAGTSGGIPAYTGATTIASSGVLAAYELVIGGGAGVAPSTTTTGAGVLVANINRPVFATTVTAAGTTTLTVTSASTQEFTGSTTQTVAMPPVFGSMVAGWATRFINKSTGIVTIQSTGGDTITLLHPGQSAILITNVAIGTTGVEPWDVVGQSPPLWLSAANDAVTAANATETNLTWTGTIGNMAGALSGATFTAPTTGKYTFRTLLQYEATFGASQPNEGNLTVKLTQSDNTNIKTIRTGGCAYDVMLNLVAGTETLEWTLSLTAGDTVKHRVTYTDGGNGSGLYFYGAFCQLKITQEL